MKKNTNRLRNKIKTLFNQEEYENVIYHLTDKVLKEQRDEELYVWRGNTWYNKKEYDKAIEDYNKIIEINSDSEIAFYNIGITLATQGKYVDAINNFNKVIEFNPNSTYAYVSRGSIRRVLKEYDKAIIDYNKAIEIDPNDSNAYYNRGLAKKESNKDLEGCKQDFEKYLELAIEENEIWTKYAKYYIEKLNERINDKELSTIADLVSKIKDILLIEEDCITHYTSLSVLKSLILDKSKFRISEGNFMNDPSEGTEFFHFLFANTSTSYKDGSSSKTFSPKPFIGSFVTKDKHNDLNMWRFYGKEEGVEAKGGAITLRTQEFIKDINRSLQGIDDSLKYESDINFYQVVYFDGDANFYIPNSEKDEDVLRELVKDLKEKVNSYEGDNKISLEEYLNSIAFLFKSDAYKNENEVRLVVKGIEFEKKYNMNINPPRVYIELEPIKKIVEQVTLGPKVDKVNEWASTFHYSYEENAPSIVISNIPYK